MKENPLNSEYHTHTELKGRYLLGEAFLLLNEQVDDIHILIYRFSKQSQD